MSPPPISSIQRISEISKVAFAVCSYSIPKSEAVIRSSPSNFGVIVMSLSSWLWINSAIDEEFVDTACWLDPWIIQKTAKSWSLTYQVWWIGKISSC